MFGDTNFQTAYHPFHIISSEGNALHLRNAFISIIARDSSISFFPKNSNIKTYIPCLSLLTSNRKILETISDLRQ